MPFGEEDFNRDNAQRLSVIIMPRMRRHPLFSFRELNDRDKKKFNKEMNDYIQNCLGGDDWKAKLLHDFNEVCNDELFTDDFSPEKMFVPQIAEPQMLFKNETEEAWFKNASNPVPEVVQE
jgi:hypothetical protein